MSIVQQGASRPPSQAHRVRRPMIVGGGLAFVAGAVGAVALWLAAEQRYDDGVAALARAPVGCATTVTIDSAGDLRLFAEVSGRFDDIAGNCEASGVFRAQAESPLVNVDMTSSNGESVPVEAATGTDYDRGGFRGSQIGVVDVAEAGDYLVRVASEDGTFAVAIGQDPRSGVFAIRAAALVALIAGAVFGLTLLSLGRRGEPPTTAAPDQWTPPRTEWWRDDRVASAPPQRPPRPPLIPGEPPGPGWGRPAPDGAEEPPSRPPWAPPSA